MSIDEARAQGFLALVKPNRGRIAERNLRRQDFAAHLPMEIVTRRSRDRFAAFIATIEPIDRCEGRASWHWGPAILTVAADKQGAFALPPERRS
ncbi:hypothetical protein EJV44_09470 [Ancylobacter aquaticus]|nr:hypothetical protein EJV44_09470 [Ancylobacter aquaticus]